MRIWLLPRSCAQFALGGHRPLPFKAGCHQSQTALYPASQPSLPRAPVRPAGPTPPHAPPPAGRPPPILHLQSRTALPRPLLQRRTSTAARVLAHCTIWAAFSACHKRATKRDADAAQTPARMAATAQCKPNHPACPHSILVHPALRPRS